MENRLRRLVTESEDVEPGPGTAAVAIVFENFSHVLLVKRKYREDDPWSGQVAFPGGKWRDSDKSLVDTALRELEEETGLSRQAVEVVGPMSVVSPANAPWLKVKPVLCRAVQHREVHPGPEIEKVFWAPLNQLSKKTVKVYSKYLQKEIETLAYFYGGEIIWGMTARLLDKLENASVFSPG